MLTAEKLRECLSYDPENGSFTRLVSRSNRHKAGVIAGCRAINGYIRIYVGGRQYFAHRLAFLYMTGSFPKTLVDHIDGDKRNNRWANLREISKSGNAQNSRSAWGHSKSGILGVGKRNGRYRARLSVDGKEITVGYFATAEEAQAAYLQAKRILHPLSAI